MRGESSARRRRDATDGLRHRGERPESRSALALAGLRSWPAFAAVRGRSRQFVKPPRRGMGRALTRWHSHERHPYSRSRLRRGGGAWPLAEGRRDRAAVRLSRSPTRWSSPGSSRSLLIVFAQIATRSMSDVPDGAAELPRVAGRGSLRASSRASSGAHLVKRTFWFFAIDLHLHPRRELDRPDPRRRHDRLGPPDRGTASRSTSRCCAAPTPI